MSAPINTISGLVSAIVLIAFNGRIAELAECGLEAARQRPLKRSGSAALRLLIVMFGIASLYFFVRFGVAG